MYSDQKRLTMSFNAISFTADSTRVFKTPKDKRLRLRDIMCAVTTNCAGATTTPKVQVGKNGALTDSANVDLGTTAAGASFTGSQQAAGLNGASKDAITGLAPVLDKNTDFYITFKAATGAGAAGVADVVLVFDEDV